jgi:hypothetical protein
MFCAPALIVGGTEGVDSRFHVLRPQTRFGWYRGCRVPFSCFALLDSFSAIPRASGPVFMFCAPRLVFGGTGGVGSRFHVLRAKTRFQRYRGPRVLFSCFASPDSFSTVPRASGHVFIFCAPGLVLAVPRASGIFFHVLRARTPFRRYLGPSGPVFMFCAPGLVFGVTERVGYCFLILRSRNRLCGSEGVGSCFHVLRSRSCFGQCRGRRSRFHVLRSRTRIRRNRGRWVPFSCFARPD